jgi:TolB protein
VSVVHQQIDSNLWIAPKGDENQPKQLTSAAQGTEGTRVLNWPPGDKIFYSSADSSSFAAWSVDTDGSHPENISNPKGAIDLGFSACPSGWYVVFDSNRQGGVNLWRINQDGKGLTHLTHGSAKSGPSCSPDGKSVVFNSVIHAGPQLWRVSIQGGRGEKITNQPCDQPSISPNGE